MTAPLPALHSTLQRVDGHARVRFVRRGLRSTLADLYQRAPCRMLFPDGADGEFPLAVALTTSGGLTGGDRVTVEISVDPGASATVMSQAAEKLYRVMDGDAPIVIDTRIEVAAGARAEWLAQEAILFDRTRLNRRTEARIAGDARLLAVESLVFGRRAMGETLRHGLVRDHWRIWRDGRLVWADGLGLSGDIAALAAEPWGLGNAAAMATLVYAGPDAATLLPLAREQTTAPDSGATFVNGMIVMRFLDSDAAALRVRLTGAIGALRAAAFGLSPILPAPWTC